jgi:hypothetical protein
MGRATKLGSKKEEDFFSNKTLKPNIKRKLTTRNKTLKANHKHKLNKTTRKQKSNAVVTREKADKKEHVFKLNEGALVCGPTMSGKTVFIRNLIVHEEYIFGFKFDHIWYYYGIWSDFFKTFPPKVKFTEGLPDIETIEKNTQKKLIIIDDLVTSVNSDIVNIFIRSVHHANATVFFMSQNIFTRNPFFRTISLNIQKMVLFKNARDIQQLAILGRQLLGSKYKALEEAFNDVTKSPYGYIVINCSQSSNDSNKLQTGIFPNETLTQYRII